MGKGGKKGTMDTKREFQVKKQNVIQETGAKSDLRKHPRILGGK